MNLSGVSEIKALILACVASSLAARGLSSHSVPDDLDLRAVGVVDSLGFLQLIDALELRLQRRIDLSELDPSLLTNVGALAAHIANNGVTP